VVITGISMTNRFYKNLLVLSHNFYVLNKRSIILWDQQLEQVVP